LTQPKALCLLRADIAYRRSAFCNGLEACGFEVVPAIPKPTAADALLIWNRYGDFDVIARQFEHVGATVFVAENGWLGKQWHDKQWYTLCIGHHCGAGRWNYRGDWRWDSWGVSMSPWRTEGERVILAQRGIGESGIASPKDWAEKIRGEFGGRIRPHPGDNPRKTAVPLDEDLKDAGEVLTWTSGAALRALLLGIPVRCAFERWIGRSAASDLRGSLNRDDSARLNMFRRLAWSMWTLPEIENGDAFRI